jgi:hypothetical protein
MSKETLPDEVLIEAAKRSNANPNLSLKHWRSMYRTDGMFTALCDMIQKYEKPPVDRKLRCAREAVRLHNERHVFSHGLHTPEEVCVRAIELWEESFEYE